MEIEGTTRTCGACGVRLTSSGQGRRARYCSNACRQRAFRQRGRRTNDHGPGAAIPEPLDSFIGREQELAALKELTRASRLVTLVGPPGVGKTRLALEAARREAGGRRRQIRLVELAPVSDGARILETIAFALGVREPALSQVAEAINEQRVALVADNCEQVVAHCAVVLWELLDRCPGLRVLATSREPLRVAGEALLPVDPLPVDGLDAEATREQLLASSAVHLFLDRAKSVGRELTDVAAVALVCHRLDGLPLAIEMAARQAHSMSVREILWCLDDQLTLLCANTRTAGDRQRDLWSAVEWSYRLLSDVERQVLRRLAPLPGGLTPGAAELVCDVAGAGAVLNGLAAKSLVLRSGDRFRMLEPIRSYALERLRLAGELEATTRRAARWAAELADPLLSSAFMTSSVVRGFDEEGDNLYAVHELLRDHPEEADTQVLLAAAVARVWKERGRIAAAGELLRDVLEQHPSSVNAPVVLLMASWQALVEERLREALRYAGLAVSAITGTERPTLEVRALKQLIRVLEALGRPASSECLQWRVISLCERLHDPLSLAQARHDLAWLLLCAGETAEPRALLEQVLPVVRRNCPPDSVGGVLHTAGTLELRAGRPEQAEEYFIEGLDAAPSDTHIRPYSLEGLAMVAEYRGDATRAGRLFAAARTTRARYGGSTAAVWRRWVEESAARVTVPDADELSEEAVLNYARGVSEVVRHPAMTLLSPVEHQVLELIVAGDSNAQVARKLGTSASTVTNLLDAVLAKVRLDNRAQLIRWHVETRVRCATR